MLSAPLVPSRRPGGDLVLEIPASARVLPGLIAAALLFAVAALAIQGSRAGSLVVPAGLFVLCSFAALYHERWICDPGSRSLTHQLGLIFAYRARVMEAEGIARIVLTGIMARRPAGRGAFADSTRGRVTPRSYVGLFVEDTLGRRRRIEQVMGHGAVELEAAGRRIAEICRVELSDRVVHAGE